MSPDSNDEEVSPMDKSVRKNRRNIVTVPGRTVVHQSTTQKQTFYPHVNKVQVLGDYKTASNEKRIRKSSSQGSDVIAKETQRQPL